MIGNNQTRYIEDNKRGDHMKGVQQKFCSFNRELNENKFFKYIIFFIFLFITFILILKHEIWTDEAEAWVIARELSLIDIIKQMKYEASPCLWHLLLAIPAKLGLSVFSMHIISWAFIGLAAYVIIFHAKWNIIVKLVVIFNPTFLYFLPVIARCYSLIAVLLLIWGVCYSKRLEYPIIYTLILCLLANTHIVICGFVGIASFIFILEYIHRLKHLSKRKFIAVLLILTFALIFLCIQIFPSFEDCTTILYKDFSSDKLKSVWIKLGDYFLTYKIISQMPGLLVILLLSIAILLYIYDKKKMAIYFITMIVFVLIHMYWPFTLYERTCLIFVIIITLNLNNKNVILQFILLSISTIMIIDKFHYIEFDLHANFSDSKETATWINHNIKNGSTLVFLNQGRYVSVVPYIKKKINYYNIRNNTYQAYITWGDFIKLDAKETSEKINSLTRKSNQDVYIIISWSYDLSIRDSIDYISPFVLNNKAIQVYSSSANVNSKEFFMIYKVNGNFVK